jgi:methyl-accepting chemotaxis protein
MPAEFVYAFWGFMMGSSLTWAGFHFYSRSSFSPTFVATPALPQEAVPRMDAHVAQQLLAAQVAIKQLIARSPRGPITAKFAPSPTEVTTSDPSNGTLLTQAQELQTMLSQFDAWLDNSVKDNDTLRETITQVATATTRMDSRLASMGPVFNEAALLCTASNDHLQAFYDLSKSRRERLAILSEDWQTNMAILQDFATRLEEMQSSVRVVQDAATKAKLLSLNAAIVASQSGEHGRGFSVVADQIKSLSVRTQAAAQGMEHCVTQIVAHKKQMDLLARQVSATLAEGHLDHTSLEQRTLEVQTTNTTLRHLLELRTQTKDDGALSAMNEAVSAMVQNLLNFNAAVRIQAKDARRAAAISLGLTQSVAQWTTQALPRPPHADPQAAVLADRAQQQAQAAHIQATQALVAINAALNTPLG